MEIQSARYPIYSGRLQREVVIECYGKADLSGPVQLLLINDGQQMESLGLAAKIAARGADKTPLLAVAIHAGDKRLQEYGTARAVNDKGQGMRATSYTRFVLQELLPFVQQQYPLLTFDHKAFAGFSLGGLSALDIVWQHPNVFQAAGVFSGALWWRNRALDKGYVESTDRIMHALVQEKGYQAGLRFFFECGTKDETADRNNNGVIDMIDDTLDLMHVLEGLGYDKNKDLRYLEIDGGRHDEMTWSKGMDVFLDWL